MNMPSWTWRWAWRALMRWSRLSIDAQLTGSERWHMALAVIRAGVCSYYVDPICRWVLANSPVWVVKVQLKPAAHGWYCIPAQSSANHCRLRFDVYPIDVGDMLHFRSGRVSHVAYCGPRHTEILEFLPSGDLAPASDIPEMQRAWAAFFSANRAGTGVNIEDGRAHGR